MPSANTFARRQKCVSARKAGARSLEDLLSAKIHNLSDFSKQIKHEQFIKDIKCPKTQTIDYLCILLYYRFFLKNAQKSFVFGKLLLPL